MVEPVSFCEVRGGEKFSALLKVLSPIMADTGLVRLSYLLKTFHYRYSAAKGRSILGEGSVSVYREEEHLEGHSTGNYSQKVRTTSGEPKAQKRRYPVVSRTAVMAFCDNL